LKLLPCNSAFQYWFHRQHTSYTTYKLQQFKSTSLFWVQAHKRLDWLWQNWTTTLPTHEQLNLQKTTTKVTESCSSRPTQELSPVRDSSFSSAVHDLFSTSKAFFSNYTFVNCHGHSEVSITSDQQKQ
jgi:hypothetical protein